jgi:AraC-like DNA-binding protein
MLTTLPTLKRFLKLAYTTFSDELKYYRLDEACWAAQNTDLSMAQLSDELGFQDANSFARLFKGEMGTTFNQFRSEKKG